jgi:hypothetical protein
VDERPILKALITRVEEYTRRFLVIDLLEWEAYVKMVPGNHDTLSTWCLGHSLECWFHATPDVMIDNEPRNRKYHQFGQVILMFTHGDKGKRPNYPLVMATEQPQMFGATVHREAHTGHGIGCSRSWAAARSRSAGGAMPEQRRVPCRGRAKPTPSGPVWARSPAWRSSVSSTAKKSSVLPQIPVDT